MLLQKFVDSWRTFILVKCHPLLDHAMEARRRPAGRGAGQGAGCPGGRRRAGRGAHLGGTLGLPHTSFRAVAAPQILTPSPHTLNPK